MYYATIFSINKRYLVDAIHERSIIFVTKQICVPSIQSEAHTGILKYANFLFEFPIWIFYEVQILLLCE